MTIRGPFAVTLVVVALVSLAANLMIAGFTVSRFTGQGPGGGEIDRIVSLGIRAFPPEIQGDIRNQVRAHRDEFRRGLDAVRASRQRMFAAMRANPFDRPALDAAFADVRSTTNDVQTIGQTIVADAIAHAPADIRARIRPPRGPFP
jgi:uncharacterized membrane protein